MKYGYIVENEKIIDEVLVSYFKEPMSYTTENMCEINSHGGNVVMKKILELCLKNGAQLACLLYTSVKFSYKQIFNSLLT